MTPIYATSTYAAAIAGRAQGLRLRPQPQSHAVRLRALRGRSGRRCGRPLPLPRAWRPLPPCWNCSITARTCWCATISTAARFACSSGCGAARRISISRYVDPTNLDAFRAAIRPNTRMIWIESPSNPLLKLADLAAIAELAREHGVISVADNTFATPYVQRPLALGFDIVVHSVTKYLNGHSDMIGGVAVVGENRPWPSGSGSCKTPSAPSPGRSTASWRCAG